MVLTCRNSLVCFACGRLGHRSHQYISIMMFQSPPSKPSSQVVAKANSLFVVKFYSNLTNKKFPETIRYSLVFHDELGSETIFIQIYLQQLFFIPG
jgi:hypothetical protein